MTTIAMGAGMLPIAIGMGTDPSFRAPMAIVVIGGLITSTFLSLLVIPVLFTYVDDPRDLRFALDTLLAGPLGERIDRRRIAAAGHSYGANTTLLAAGARVERDGRTVDLHDERLSAALVLSAPPFYGEADASRILSPVRLPTLHVTATGDVIRIPGYWSGAEDRIAVYEAVGSRRKALAVFEGGSHSMFTDRAGTGGAELNPRVKQATRELTQAFLEAQFGREGTAPLAQWAERHRAIVARFDLPVA
jgi:predicted dienelactone hydrolase